MRDCVCSASDYNDAQDVDLASKLAFDLLRFLANGHRETIVVCFVACVTILESLTLRNHYASLFSLTSKWMQD